MKEEAVCGGRRGPQVGPRGLRAGRVRDVAWSTNVAARISGGGQCTCPRAAAGAMATGRASGARVGMDAWLYTKINMHGR